MACHPRSCQVISGHCVFCAFLAVCAPATPLLEEKGDILFFALALNIDYPFLLHSSGFRAGFAAHNDPMDASQVDFTQILQQRLYRQESYPCPDPVECIDALATDADNEDPINTLLGHAITHRIAVGPQTGRKVFA